MNIRTAIIGLFIFAFTATTYAQQSPYKSRHQAATKVSYSKHGKNVVAVKNKRHKMNKKQCVVAKKRLSKAEKRAIKREQRLAHPNTNKGTKRVSRRLPKQFRGPVPTY